MKKQELEKKSSEIVVRAKKIRVSDQKTLNEANLFLVYAKESLKQAEDFFAPAIQKAHEAHKEMIKAKNVITDPMKLAVNTASGAIRAYIIETERKAREAEDERKFKEEAYLSKLKDQREAGEGKKAAKTLAKVQELHDESMKIEVKPELIGTHVTRRWKYRVVDPTIIPRQYLIPDHGKIQAVVTQMKEKAAIPGIETFEDVGITKGRS